MSGMGFSKIKHVRGDCEFHFLELAFVRTEDVQLEQSKAN